MTLHYFAKRGRAEAIRMLMVDQHIPFTEKNYTTQTWLEAKAHGTATGIFTFGQGFQFCCKYNTTINIYYDNLLKKLVYIFLK